MAVIKNWVETAAKKIYDFQNFSVKDIEKVIREHCPFKEGVVYEEIKVKESSTKS